MRSKKGNEEGYGVDESLENFAQILALKIENI